jgi:predicted Zn-dependent peptidase
MTRLLSWAAAFVLLPGLLCAQDLEEFEKRVTEFTLDNGLHFIVLERHNAPVVSFYAQVDAGSANDPSGKTGIAHMFEHMIGKGTTRVGTNNWKDEEHSLTTVEKAYDALEAERRKGPRADEKRLKGFQEELDAAIKAANSYAVQNEFPRVIEQAGGVGFNAGTGRDYTVYFYSLPSNKLELWFLLQSEWFRRPVYREFYKERDVVREERRMRVESNPGGKLFEGLVGAAFAAHPYGVWMGWASDTENLRVEDADRFHRTYYVPGNITIAIAGDVDPKQARELAEKYYGRIPAGPLPPRLITEEPEQQGERRVEVESPSQPLIAIAYKRPNRNHPDDPVFDVVSGILASGRTGILYKELVRDKQIALAAVSAASFPANKFPTLFVLYGVPNMGNTVEEVEEAMYEVIDRLKEEKVDAETLQRVKTKVRAGVIRSLDSNSGLAGSLVSYHQAYGDWRVLFNQIDIMNKVTAEDVQRVVRTYFKKKHRTVAYHVKPEAEKPQQENAE